MYEYRYYIIQGNLKQLKECDNPECSRLTSTIFCCHGCDLASGRYEIHDDGPLGHSEACNERDKERQGLKPFATNEKELRR